jgi:hypothetical protein
MPKNMRKIFDEHFRLRLQLSMIHYVLILLFFALSLNSQNSFGKQATVGLRYTIKDLEVLRNESDYDDFFLHVNDIRPSLRDNFWKDLVDEMALKWAQSMKNAPNFEIQQFRQMEEIFSLGPVKTNERFKQIRNTLGLSFFEKNLNRIENVEVTLNLIESFWKRDQTSFETGLELFKLVFKETNDIEKAWLFAIQAFKSQQGAFYCPKKDLEPLIFLKLAKSLEESPLAAKKVIFKTIDKDCWEQLKPIAKNYFFSFPQRVRGPFLTLLKDEKLLSNDEIDLFSFFYLMEGPIQGDSMNMAWNTVNDLKNNKTRRDILLEGLLASPVLPDGILSGPNQERKKIIVQFVSKSFPEYFDFYAKTCIQYLKGEIKYPNGNPTLHCRDLFEMNKKGNDLVNPVLTFQYQQSVKI